MEEIIRDLHRMQLLSVLPQGELRQGLEDRTLTLRSFEKQNIVHFSGEKCTRLDVILSGEVAVERIDASGNLMSIAEFAEGDLLGGNLLFSRTPYYPMTITAVSKVQVLEIEREKLFSLFADYGEFLRSYLEYISDHAAILGDRLQNYANRSIRECVMMYLESESKRQKTDYIELAISKKALAEKFGVQRTSLSRELAKMRRDGLIEYDAKGIRRL